MSELEKTIFAKEVAISKHQIDKEEQWKLKENALEEREGRVSVKEFWLKEKEETLRATKSELEKHFNRTINNVII